MIDYEKLTHAIGHYQYAEFKYIEVPWAVDDEISRITVPDDRAAYPLEDQELIGSGEQGFMQLIADGKLPEGRYSCLTPCFRREPFLDELHKQYFMKVELIDTKECYGIRAYELAELARGFFANYLQTKKLVITTETPNKNSSGIIEHFTYDVSYDGIELGSYGLREHPKIGKWVYGTGCAEPRLSYVQERQ